MRNGIILSYNKVVGVGLIKDSNHQHIFFHHTAMSIIPVRGSAVTFEIEYIDGALFAVDVRFSDVKLLSEHIPL